MQGSDIAESNEERDINDVFSDILLSEERLFEESYNEGYELGKRQENLEAFHLGYHRGAEVGAEIGYYTSVIIIYLKKNAGDEKLVRELTSLKNLLATFPKHNDPNIDILELLSKIRAKFKKICAKLKIHPEFPESDPLSF
jgi:hypothetical protein